MTNIDLNCDLGEGIGNEPAIMPYISSANIACGYHAGDEKTMWQTVEKALENKVAIGAHVSFLDRENFGRSNIKVPLDEVYEWIEQQLLIFYEICSALDASISHVKPHGALYNLSAVDAELATTVAKAVKDIDPGLTIFGLSGSESIKAAKSAGLKFANEVFADRRYSNDGTLISRTEKGALIENEEEAIAQVLQILQQGTVTSTSGIIIPIKADTICIHGDGENAVQLAKSINEAIKNAGIIIENPSQSKNLPK